MYSCLIFGKFEAVGGVPWGVQTLRASSGPVLQTRGRDDATDCAYRGGVAACHGFVWVMIRAHNACRTDRAGAAVWGLD